VPAAWQASRRRRTSDLRSRKRQIRGPITHSTTGRFSRWIGTT